MSDASTAGQRSRATRWRDVVTSVTLTGRGAGFLVLAVGLFVAAAALSLPALLYGTGLLLALVVLSGLVVLLGHSQLRVERTFAPPMVAAGQSSRATLEVTNLSVLPCAEAAWHDVVPRAVAADASGIVPALGGGRSADAGTTVSYDLVASRRGLHAVGPLRLRVGDPFGLVNRRRVVGGTTTLTVLPRLVELSELRARGTSDDGASLPSPQHVGLGDDDIIARTYQSGDAMKRLHWKATAHRGELMVRQEEQQVTPRAGIVLDCEPRSHGTAYEPGAWQQAPGFEWSVVAAASIATHLVRAGYVVSLQSSDGTVDRLLSEGHDSLEDAMIDLAVVDTRDDGPAPSAERVTFVLLGRPDAERARHWVTTLSSARTALALVDESTSAAAMEVLDAARWRVVPYGARDDLAELWPALDGSAARAAR
jgi:uncharacterized protein (DUF58 family)